MSWRGHGLVEAVPDQEWACECRLPSADSKGRIVCRELKKVIKTTRSQFAFYYHHRPTIRNDFVSDRMLLPTNLSLVCFKQLLKC